MHCSAPIRQAPLLTRISEAEYATSFFVNRNRRPTAPVLCVSVVPDPHKALTLSPDTGKLLACGQPRCMARARGA